MMYFVLPAVLLAEFFGSEAPRLIRYAPELCGLAASAYLVVHAVRHGFAKIRFVYWVLIALLALHILFGIIANDVKAGTVIIGGRMYLRTVPFFLLAITMVPSEKTLKRQFFLVLGIAMLQFPVAAYQRISNYQQALAQGHISTTGDYVVGTLGISSYLSIFLICFSTIIVALSARKQINMLMTAGILLVVLAPTMINETKGTLFMVPLAVGIPMIMAARQNRVKNTIKTLFLLIGFVAIFIPVYDYYVMPRWGYGIVDFFLMEGRVEGYLSKEAEVGTTGPVGRIDTITTAYEVLRKDPVSAMFGLGIGSITESTFGPRFEGEYYSRYGGFGGTTYARLFWEIGFVGAGFVLLLLYFIFRDALRSYRKENAYGIVAHAYLAVIPLMAMSMMYTNMLLCAGISVCFWYYCGVVAAAAQLPDKQGAVQPDKLEKSGRHLHGHRINNGSTSAAMRPTTHTANRNLKQRL